MPFFEKGFTLGFQAPAEIVLNYWVYSCLDPMEEILRPQYFRPVRGMLRTGDLILCGTGTRPRGPAEAQPAPMRRFLLMVAHADNDRVSVRLVQDYGTPEGSPADVAAVATAPA